MIESADYAPPLFDTLGGVALHIANTAGEDLRAWRRDLRYTPAQAIEVVCRQRRSIASRGRSPSLLWAHLSVDAEGVPSPVIDLGRMPLSARIPGAGGAYRFSWPGEQMEAGGPWYVLAPETVGITCDRTAEHDWPLRTGIALGQRFLVEAHGDTWRCSHEYAEFDSSWDVTLLYLDAAPPVTYLPVPTPFTKIAAGK